MPAKRHFEFVEGTSNKFWEIWKDGQKVYTRYGRIGSDGQITEKNEANEDTAKKLYEKLVREKTGKGYVEKDGAPAKTAKASAPLKKAKKAAPAKKIAGKKVAGKKKKLEIPELTPEYLFGRAREAAAEQETRVAAARAAEPTALRPETATRPSYPISWTYNFAFDTAIPKAERDELATFFKRFTKLDKDRGGFVVVGPKTTPEARRIGWEEGVVLELEQLRAQLPTDDVAARTARLLDVLSKPSSARWNEAVMLLSTWPRASLPDAIAAADRALAAWPDAVRTPVAPWKNRPELGALTRLVWGDVGEAIAAGHLEHVTVLNTQDAAGLEKHQQKLGHVKSLDLSGKSGLAEVVARCTALTGLEQLELQQPTYSEGTAKIDLAALLAAPHLQKLTALSLYGYELDAADLDALAACPQPLARVRLNYAKMKPRAGAALAKLASRKRLVSLDLKYNDLGPKGAQALFANPKDWSALRVLDFSANEIGDKGVAALAAADLCELRWLNLSSNDSKEQLTATSAKALASAPSLGKLEILILYGHPVGPEGVAALVEAPALRAMRELCVAFPSADPASIIARCGKREPVALEQLHLGNAQASKKPADWTRATFLSKVHTLNVDSLDGAEYAGLLACPHLGSLEVLALGCDHGANGRKGLAALAAAAHPPPRLRYLNLSGYKLTKEEATAIATSPLGKQLWGVELMQSYTVPEAWRAFYDAGVPLTNYVMFDSNPANEHSPMTTFREEHG